MMAGVAFEGTIDCEPGAKDVFKWPGVIGNSLDGSSEEGKVKRSVSCK